MNVEKKQDLLRTQLAGSGAAANGEAFNAWRERTSAVLWMAMGL